MSEANENRPASCMPPSSAPTNKKLEAFVRSFMAATARNPRNFDAYFEMAFVWDSYRQYAKALEMYNQALALRPRCADALRARAEFLATCPEPSCRDGDAAVRDAKAAIECAQLSGEFDTRYEQGPYLETLAAAYAEVGNFQEAVKVQKEALDRAITKRRRDPMQVALKEYESGLPHRVEGVVLKTRYLSTRSPD
jgi:tetratricopeptide (TPR) repeat protein